MGDAGSTGSRGGKRLSKGLEGCLWGRLSSVVYFPTCMCFGQSAFRDLAAVQRESKYTEVAQGIRWNVQLSKQCYRGGLYVFYLNKAKFLSQTSTSSMLETELRMRAWFLHVNPPFSFSITHKMAGWTLFLNYFQAQIARILIFFFQVGSLLTPMFYLRGSFEPRLHGSF